MLEQECKKLLAIMSNYSYTFDELMYESEARTEWMFKAIKDAYKEQNDKFEEEANMNKLKVNKFG